MRSAGIVGVTRRKWHGTTRREPTRAAAPDLVERTFRADRPDQLWVADITYIPTWTGFLYLAIVLDVCSRRIVGWAMATTLQTDLVLDALNMAIGQRQPEAVIHHSDQGCQYTSVAFGRRCQEVGVRPSMGLGRRLLRQRDGREFLRDPRMRAPQSPALPHPGRRPDGDL